jgi:hypothetical protein
LPYDEEYSLALLNVINRYIIRIEAETKLSPSGRENETGDRGTEEPAGKCVQLVFYLLISTTTT